LKAGLNVEAAMDLLSEEAPAPLHAHLQSRWVQNRWRAPSDRIALLLEDASLVLAKATLLLSYQTGGTIAPLLENVARLLKAQLDLRERIHTLTIQGKTSAWIVGLSPFFLLGGFALFSPDYVLILFTTKTGWILLGTVIIMIGAGLYFVHRVARVEES
jgi:tight adherence protein B